MRLQPPKPDKEFNRMFNAVFVLAFLWFAFWMAAVGTVIFMAGRWLAIW